MIADMTNRGLIDFCEGPVLAGVSPREAQLLVTAVREVMSVFGGDSVRLSQKLHAEDVLGEFARLRGHYTPSTLATYRSRFRKATRLYGAYVQAPAKWQREVGGEAGMPRQASRDYEFPLRSGVVTSFRLPKDLTKGEAARLAQFIEALGL